MNLNLPTGAGDGVDLVLDTQGRLRMAYLVGEDLHYSSCESGCDDADTWQHRGLDTTGQMEADFPIPLPITCNAGVWDTSSPVLAFDPDGNPHIAYDGSYKARCQFQNPDDPNDIRDEFLEIRHAVRVVQGSAQSSTSTVHGITRVDSNPTSASTVAFTVTFATAVSGVSVGSFDLTTTGSLQGAAVTSVQGDSTTWTVTVNTGTGSGVLRLNLMDATGITPALTNVPFTFGEAYTVDRTDPTDPTDPTEQLVYLPLVRR